MNQGARRRAALLLGSVAWLGARAPAFAQSAASEATPLRLQSALGVAPWFRFAIEQRTRFESLRDDFRRTTPGDHHALFLRTLLPAEARTGPVFIGGELADARAYASATTPLNTGLVNTLEVLQAYTGFLLRDVLAEGDRLALHLGRLTMDVGSRRLIARNEFRNTSNAFTGVDLRWTSRGGAGVRAFVVVPVTRRPADPVALEKNRVTLDREDTDAVLWGVFHERPLLAGDGQLESYLFGLHEDAAARPASLHRRLATLGARMTRAPRPGRFDLQMELMGQAGWSRATPDGMDLVHQALALHMSAGRGFEVKSLPRLALVYDFASGDRDPSDGRQGRFDPLFGARRFDWGPTGLFGALARGNVSSPGVRVEVVPLKNVDAFAAYRLHWLVARRDLWGPGGLRDPNGNSGRFVGQLFEARGRWHVLPGNLSLELGSACLLRGAFARQAPGGRVAPSLFFYTQVTGTI